MASYHAHFRKPNIGMKMVSTEELPNRAVTIGIQTYNNNKTRSEFQAEQTEGLENSGIKRIGRKQAQE